MMTDPNKLLPSDHKEFNSKEYWNHFFQERNKTAFEWYGVFGDVVPHLLPAIQKTDRHLVIGCGNSNFSSELYDLGYHDIVNVDFSELVIEEMKEKNTSTRPLMTWDIGDMTKLDSYSPSSFHTVLDKGALDALLSADTEELRSQALCMFQEIDRVLQENGKYICITLAESYVLKALVDYFIQRNNRWKMDIWPIFTSSRSPFMPFLVIIEKSTTAFPILEKLAVHVSTTGQQTDHPQFLTSEQVQLHLAHLQHYIAMSYRMGSLDIGRFEVIQLYANDQDHIDVPRFTIYIVDVSDQAKMSCAVFLVPIGRESEYQFTSKNGLIDIAYQAQCKRLISVCCNRPHSFPDSVGLQAELSPIMMSLKPAGMSEGESIPYLGVGADYDWQLLEEGRSDLSGGYLVEERDHEATGGVVRRLIFLQNQQLVQTEVRLLRSKRKEGGGSGKSNKKKGKGNSNSAKKAGVTGSGDSEEALSFDYQYIDDHHRGMMAGLTLVASLPLTASTNQTSSSPSKQALVIGLGGGALLMAMQRLLPQLRITAVEIDNQVKEVAEKYFGFQPRRSTEVVIADGLNFLSSSNQQTATTNHLYDLIILDVDGKDLSIGLSAPPKAFVEEEIVRTMYNLLSSHGILVLNVVARSSSALQGVIDTLKKEFHYSSSSNLNIFVMQPSKENVNVEIFCCKTAPSYDNQGSSKTSAKVRPAVHYMRTLDAWLKNCGQSDFLELEELNLFFNFRTRMTC
eukprot:scaffold667_cov168-Ochromonas_danica.AAC.32